jgi:hypothetical protein
MSTSRCPIVRPQTSKYGPKFNDYHSFDGNTMRATCRHCGQTRKQCQTAEHDRFWGEDMDAAAGRAPPHERFHAPRDPQRWPSVQRALAAITGAPA